MIRRFAKFALPLVLVPNLVWADDAGWRMERYNMVVRDQSVRDVLVQFGALAGVPVVVSDDVEARVSATFDGATGEQIVDAIAREYALDWRFDGRRIEVSSSSEQVSRILDMGGVSRADLVKSLDSLGAYESRFPITAVDGRLALLVGPPRYVGIVEIVLAEMVEARASQGVLDEAERLRIESAAKERREEAERLRLAEEERLRVLLDRERSARSARPARTAPLVNRGGRWGG